MVNGKDKKLEKESVWEMNEMKCMRKRKEERECVCVCICVCGERKREMRYSHSDSLASGKGVERVCVSGKELCGGTYIIRGNFSITKSPISYFHASSCSLSIFAAMKCVGASTRSLTTTASFAATASQLMRWWHSFGSIFARIRSARGMHKRA